MLCMVAAAQGSRRCYLRNYNGFYLHASSAGKAQLQKGDFAAKFYVSRISGGYYNIIREDASGNKYLTLSGDRDLVFSTTREGLRSQFVIEDYEGGYAMIKCRHNSRYMYAVSARAGSDVCCDNSGNSSKCMWYLGDVTGVLPDTVRVEYAVKPGERRQLHEGWGVSLAWWANMCGRWSDDKIDQIIEWLVSPTGLNYSVFRYNIGGGDDPANSNCDPHHMGSGKGLRAEMEGFKDSSDGDYIWTRDKAQRKIMLKIKEKRPDAVFEAFSNSAPYYMTNSGCVSGNSNAWHDNLNPAYYEEFAHYLVDICRHYKEEYGIEFRTLEPFNEPYTDYWGRNGGQEGCHFDYASQIAFLKVLYPILKESGLDTVISASDECVVDSSIGGFEAYRDAGVLDMVAQWNTHTYNANNSNRARLSTLVRGARKKLWMSETGAGGDGLKGNLDMTRRLFDDVRYLQCAVWCDWQFIEEWNDQWCLVKADFNAQSYQRVKNYYVRQHVTRFIKNGYHFISTSDDNTLGAVNEAGDTLVLVAINSSNVRRRHECVLTGHEPSEEGRSMYLTTATGNMLKSSYEYNDGKLSFTLPDQSISTLVIPIAPSSDIGAVDMIGMLPVTIATRRSAVVVTADGCQGGRVALYALDGSCEADTGFSGSITLPVAAGYHIVRVSTPWGTRCCTVKVP